MKKPLLNIVYFTIIWFISNQLQKVALNWIMSESTTLIISGSIISALCLVAAFVSGWKIGGSVYEIVKYYREKRKS